MPNKRKKSSSTQKADSPRWTKQMLAEEELRNKRSTAFHEAGHYVMCRWYHFPAKAYIWRSNEQPTEVPGWPLFEGRIWHPVIPSPYKAAVIAWAGFIAASLFDSGTPVEKWPEEYMDEHEDTLSALYDGVDTPDIIDIERYPNSKRTFKAAWDLVLKQRDEIARIADQLFKDEEVGEDNPLIQEMHLEALKKLGYPCRQKD